MAAKEYSFVAILLFFVSQLHSTAGACTPGHYRPTPDSQCLACSSGTYQPNFDAKECIPCAAGFISIGEASSSCTACRSSETSDASHTFCICEVGYYFNVSTAKCEICPAGSQSLPGKNNRYCSRCPVNSYQPKGGASNCLPCPPGSKAPVGATECISCREGEVPIDGKCGSCPAGSIYNKFQARCLPCPPGQFSVSSGVSEDCDTCPAGLFSGYGYTSCVSCPEGTALMKSGSCGSCQPGEYFSKVLQSCEKCLPNTYNPSSSVGTFCAFCGSNSFSFQGSATCKTCKEGRTLLSTGRCGMCRAGTYLDEHDGRKCKECPLNQFSTRGILKFCSPCPNGSYSFPGSAECFACPTRQALILKSGKCGKCPPGRYYATYAGACLPCTGGTFKTTIGIEECQTCPNGSVSSNDFTACVPA